MRRELFKLPAADDAELFCKEVAKKGYYFMQEDKAAAYPVTDLPVRY